MTTRVGLFPMIAGDLPTEVTDVEVPFFSCLRGLGLGVGLLVW